ncbi:uncharacterized protein LOC132721825, partial [Ruditapes philippinarum]|uniref:uncharacterized protein LOC132721825 n=1 Tax=Ruditapes philippinarum TaxID=129788 RepID=UPI00295A866C
MPNPNALQSIEKELVHDVHSTPPGTSTGAANQSTPVTIVEPAPSTSGLELASTTHETENVLVTAQSVEVEEMDEESEERCLVCNKTEGKTWIFCDSCQKWLHRNCAGLRSKAKWNKYQKSGVQYFCEN